MSPARGVLQASELPIVCGHPYKGSGLFDFLAVQPIGARTSADFPRKAGGVTNIWLDKDVNEYVTENAALQSGNLDPKMTKRQHLDALGIFNSLIKSAERGQLEVGYDNRVNARIMTTVAYVIELKPKMTLGPRPPRLFRLYYSEPASIEAALLPLVLSTKPNGSDPAQEQNASVQDAMARSRTWTLYQSQGKS